MYRTSVQRYRENKSNPSLEPTGPTLRDPFEQNSLRFERINPGGSNLRVCAFCLCPELVEVSVYLPYMWRVVVVYSTAAQNERSVWHMLAVVPHGGLRLAPDSGLVMVHLTKSSRVSTRG